MRTWSRQGAPLSRKRSSRSEYYIQRLLLLFFFFSVLKKVRSILQQQAVPKARRGNVSSLYTGHRSHRRTRVPSGKERNTSRLASRRNAENRVCLRSGGSSPGKAEASDKYRGGGVGGVLQAAQGSQSEGGGGRRCDRVRSKRNVPVRFTSGPVSFVNRITFTNSRAIKFMAAGPLLSRREPSSLSLSLSTAADACEAADALALPPRGRVLLISALRRAK